MFNLFKVKEEEPTFNKAVIDAIRDYGDMLITLKKRVDALEAERWR